MSYNEEQMPRREVREKLSHGFYCNCLLNCDSDVCRFYDYEGSVNDLVTADLRFSVNNDLVKAEIKISQAWSINDLQINGWMVAKCFAVENVNLLGHAAAC